MRKSFFSLSLCLTEQTVNTQLFLQPQLVTDTAHGRCLLSLYLTEHIVNAHLFLQPQPIPTKHTINAQLFCQPQLVHHTVNVQLFLQAQLVHHTVNAHLFLQPQLVPRTAHSRYSYVSSALACISQRTLSRSVFRPQRVTYTEHNRSVTMARVVVNTKSVNHAHQGRTM